MLLIALRCSARVDDWMRALHCLLVQIEKAGGYSSADGKCISGLDVDITAYDQRTQICYGSLAEVHSLFGCAAALRL